VDGFASDLDPVRLGIDADDGRLRATDKPEGDLRIAWGGMSRDMEIPLLQTDEIARLYLLGKRNGDREDQ
jgi:hypothetical protein